MASEQKRFQAAILKGAKEILETESKNRRLEVSNISIPYPRDPNDLVRLKAARENRSSFSDKIYANIKIIDKDSNQVVKEGRVHIGDLPIKTPLLTYLIDGTHYQGANQAQLKGTAFTRIKANGEVESDFRLERGWNFKLNLDPETEEFTLRLKKGGKHPLMPILKALGAKEEDMKAIWGASIIAKNQTNEKTDQKTIRNLSTTIFGKNRVTGKSPDELKAMIRNHFEVESHINPDASRLTLGKDYSRITSDVILSSTKKILGVHSQELDPDFRDEIYYKRFRGLPETGYEWMKTQEPAMKRKIRRRIEKVEPETAMRNIIGMDIINPVIKSIFTQAKLRGAGDTTNLLDMLANDTRVTIMGEHGISNRHELMIAARDVHPSAIGFIDPVMTPQGGAGESEHITINTKIEGGKIKSSLLDIRKRQKVRMTPEDLFGKVVVFPGEMEYKKGKWMSLGWGEKIKAVKDGEIISVDLKEADYMVPSAAEMYSEITNLIPFLDSNSGGRSIMATGQMTQALPLKDPEAPLVRAQNFEASRSFAMGALSPVTGTIKSISKNRIRITDKNRVVHDVPLYDNLPLNRDAFIDSRPLVKKGDKVKRNQILADNTFTKNGILALGRNLRTAILPWKGYTYEDGQVISESAVKKLSSVHLYDLSTELGPKNQLSAGRFAAYRGNKFRTTRRNDDNTDMMTGLIKPGSTVQQGDVLVRMVTKSIADPEDNILRMLRKSIVKPFRATPIMWENENPGVVTEASIKGKKVNLFIKSVEPVQVGDKLAGREGHKGIITLILKNNEMPYDKETGKPIEVIIDPASIPSRVNIGQLLEMGATKIAEKTGKPYIVGLHERGNNTEVIKKQMTALGIKDKTTIVDPVSGREIPNINVAPKYTMKLRHQVEHKLISRNPGDAYDMDKQPIKGRTIDSLTFWALVAHGAKKNLAEMSNLKATENPEWWAQFESGVPTVLPMEPTYAWKKFEAQLKGMGINPRREGDKMVITPLTDKDTLDMSNGVITNVDVVRKKNFRPLPGGIFDPELTGGIGTDAKQWTHIKLPEPFLNPIFLKAASKVTGISAKKLIDMSHGEIEVDGLYGGVAVKSILDKINVKKELEDVKIKARELAKDTSGKTVSKMNDLNSRIRFLNGLNKFNMTPSEAYMMNYVPVMPPVFRQPIVLPDGKMSIPAANYLYKDIAQLSLKSWDDAITEKTKNEVRAELFDAIQGLTGMGEPVSNADTPGFLKQITAKPTKIQERRGITRQAKHGFFQRKVMRKRQEISSGAVISVEPNLGVDEVMIPEQAAWDMYSPMVVRRLTMRGINKPDAKQHVLNTSDIARQALQEELKLRPVFINRAPSWHKFNIMAAWPKLHSGNDLKVPNLPINTYFGGDFDGDQLSMHVPITQDAVEEAKQLMPSRMFMKSGSGTIMLKPQGSSLAGLFDLTKDPVLKEKTAAVWLDKTAAVKDKLRFTVGNKEYKNPDELQRAYRDGKIKGNELLIVSDGRRTTVGREIISNILPSGWSVSGQLNSKRINKILTEVGKENPTQLAVVANELSQLGDYHSTYMGLSIGIDDMLIDNTESKKLVRELARKIDYIDTQWEPGGRGRIKRRSAKLKEFDTYLVKLDESVVNSIPADNPFRILRDSGARGNPTQLRQILGAPTLFHSASRKEILIPVEDSFASGLTPAEYYIQQTGGRFGLIQRNVGISDPGDIGKDLFGINAGHNITEEDCGTFDGIYRPIDSRDIIDRYQAEDTPISKRNDLITEELVSAFRRRKIKSVKVRSPLTCKARIGICSYCYGLDVNGRRPPVGSPVGIDDAQGVVNVIANLALKSWHQSGGKEVGELPFYRYRKLIDLPEHLPGKAILSYYNGKVTKIEDNPLGGVDVYVDGNRHRLPASLGISMKVRMGNRIKKGDQLTLTGVKKPQEVLDLQGIRATQNYIVDEMSDIFKSEQPGNIRRKSIENLVASMTGLARVTDPGDSSHLIFDISSSNDMEYFNRHLKQTVKIKDAVGYKLAKNYGPQLLSGTRIDRQDLKILRLRGNKEVEIKKDPVKFDPILKPIQMVPTFKNDWISRLNQKYLKETLLTEAGYGGESHIYGPDPVPRFAYGVDVL